MKYSDQNYEQINLKTVKHFITHTEVTKLISLNTENRSVFNNVNTSMLVLEFCACRKKVSKSALNVCTYEYNET